jgi:hypothetical protein
MMLNSVVTMVKDRDGDGDHLTLSQSKIAIAMHKAIVKGHESAKSGRIQTMGLDDVIDTTPRAHRTFINFGDKPGSFVFVDGFDPSHF